MEKDITITPEQIEFLIEHHVTIKVCEGYSDIRELPLADLTYANAEKIIEQINSQDVLTTNQGQET